MNKLGIHAGESVIAYIGKSSITLKVVGVLYNSFFSAQGFAIIPLHNLTEEVTALDNVIILSHNETALQQFSNFLSSIKYEGLPLTDWTSITIFRYSFTNTYVPLGQIMRILIIIEIIYILISLLLIFRIRNKLSNIIALFIINGVEENRSFKLLLPPFLVIGAIPLLIYVSYYILYDVYWYPLSIAYPFVLALTGLIISSVLIEYYTIFSAYTNQHKFLKVRGIE
ncbi:hypothetical protein [Stygiolobus caldivivus]|uniref:Uncharacterized protein n=1 Tax=Stygiolobus caldivivus TaxID=2824673 RepID=A0A8D5ZJX8_9CREN|nr:hypothetical protein [Stygiolobus caldivivus]BCU71116.1 hypothetical protein KN1_24130 [Stygiolobus caldivivus]